MGKIMATGVNINSFTRSLTLEDIPECVRESTWPIYQKLQHKAH